LDEVRGSQLAPVLIFAYRRPQHLRRVVEGLRRNRLANETDVVFFVDGPSGANDIALVRQVHEVVDCVSGFRSVTKIGSTVNQGLSKSLINGIGHSLEVHDRVIVLEDDILVGPHFLEFMNAGLQVFRGDQRVASIHASVYPHEARLQEPFFIRGADCWGWATWRRAWEVFEPDGARLLRDLRQRGLIEAFDFEGTAPYKEMLIDQIQGRNDSWAVRWYASALVNEMLTLYPNQPMAINIGEDGSGTHRGSSSAYQQQLSQSPVTVERIPIVESEEGREAFREFFRARYRIPSSMLGRWLWRRARRLRNRLRH